MLLSPTAQAAQPKKLRAELHDEFTSPVEHELKLQILIKTVEKMTGRELKVLRPEEIVPKDAGETPPELREAAAAQQGRARAGYGVEYDYYAAHYEYESTSFSAEGVVHTADGREIAISVELRMSRELFQETRVSLREGDAVMKDPLVINFSGTAAQLTQTDFSFDIDLDGRKDQIAFVGPGSGFLALDRNGDGAVNDGGELFGPRSGEGFSELAALDDDGNDWIDEDDAIYGRLRIWSKEPDGSDRLIGLGAAGIGAIYLGHLETPFAVKSADNTALGQVVSSGIYLREDGGAGSVQQVNLMA